MSEHFENKFGVKLGSDGTLMLEGTNADDQDLVHCAELPGLKTLYVSRQITEAGIQNLVTATQLEELYLGDSQLVRKERAREILGASHPNLKCYY